MPCKPGANSDSSASERVSSAHLPMLLRCFHEVNERNPFLGSITASRLSPSGSCSKRHHNLHPRGIPKPLQFAAAAAAAAAATAAATAAAAASAGKVDDDAAQQRRAIAQHDDDSVMNDVCM